MTTINPKLLISEKLYLKFDNKSFFQVDSKDNYSNLSETFNYFVKVEYV